MNSIVLFNRGKAMTKRATVFVVMGLVATLAALAVVRGTRAADEDAAAKTRLAIVWTSGDPDVAHRMVFMYLHNSARNKWFAENRLVIWGPSARLLAGDKDLQAKVKQMMADGVTVQACIACADSYGVTDQIRAMGIEVKGMGKPLSELIQTGWSVLTF
jgi:hypothetical protein